MLRFIDDIAGREPGECDTDCADHSWIDSDALTDGEKHHRYVRISDGQHRGVWVKVSAQAIAHDANRMLDTQPEATALAKRDRVTGLRPSESHLGFGERTARRSVRYFELSAHMAAASAYDQFEVFFQPQVDLESWRVMGVEGLVRWHHPQHGLLLPGTFIDLVSAPDLRQAFTDCVINQSASFAARSAAQGSTIPVSVNISMASLLDSDLPGRVAAMLQHHKVDPERLKFEITEDDIIEEYSAAAPVLTQLVDMGIGLSIDDFGTGHSSMARLVDLPVTEIKIDSRFVAHAVEKRRERAVIESIVNLAGRLRLSVVAEGIENQIQADMLVSLGCTVGQGFLYSPAVEPATVLQMLSEESPQPSLSPPRLTGSVSTTIARLVPDGGLRPWRHERLGSSVASSPPIIGARP